MFLKEFHANEKLVKGSNSSFIVPIPKEDRPQKIRHISFIGYMYKVLSKILAYRPRKVIHSIILESQKAFIKGRQILDGVLVANEIVEDAILNKKDAVFFKVEFEKAYDSELGISGFYDVQDGL